MWPSFWLLPVSNESKPELDVVEILGDAPQKAYMTFHYLDLDGKRVQSSQNWVGADFSKGWHTFGIDWNPGQITWFIDGRERFRFTEEAFIPAEPMYLILNLAVGGNWPGNPDASTRFPSKFEIDYIRVYQRSDIKYEVVQVDPVADTYVDSSAERANFRNSDTVFSDGQPTKISFLKYDTTFWAGKRLVSAFLRIHTTKDPGSPSEDLHFVSLVDSSDWDEGLINFDSHPAISNTILGTIRTATWVDTTYTIPLEASLLKPYIGAILSLGISSSGADGLYLYSRESPPGGVQLLLNLIEE